MRCANTPFLLATLILITGCTHPYPPINPSVAENSVPTAVVGAPAPVFTSHKEDAHPPVPADLHLAPSHPAPHTPSGGGHHELGMAPMEALGLLVDGNSRFMRGKATHPSQSGKRRAELTSGQKPHAIVLSCSDSRVPPELVFDQGLGELFVVRTAGEVADATALASMEYAIEHLGSRLIVVMGHSSCGAVKAALATPPGSSAGSENLDTLVGMIRPNLKDFTADIATKEPTVRAPVKAHVDGVAKSLMQRSHIIKEAVRSGNVKIVHGLYNLSTGKVDLWF